MSKPMYATRAFKDAGTEREFAAGEQITGVDAGTMRNYRAGGLAGPQDADAEAPEPEQAVAEPNSPKPARRARTRSKPATKPA